MSTSQDETQDGSPNSKPDVDKEQRSFSVSSNDTVFSSLSSPTSSGLSLQSQEQKSIMNTSPFTLNVKKSVGLSSSSSLSSSHSLMLSPNLMRDNLSTDQKTSELQKEILCLKKEIEAKDAKLSSSLKSIKQFWSPELKKERAYRKEETEKFLILQDKYQIANSQIEEYKNTLEDLESELNSQQSQISSLHKKMQNEQAKTKELVKDIDELSSTNNDLNEKLEHTQNLEGELEKKNKLIEKLNNELKEKNVKDDETADQTEFDILCQSLGMKQEELMELEKKYECLQKNFNELSEQKETFEKNAQKELDNLNQEFAASQDTIVYLEQTLDKQEELYVSTANELEQLQKKDQEDAEKIHSLECLLDKKDKEFNLLEKELKSVNEELHEVTQNNKVDESQVNTSKISLLEDELKESKVQLEKLQEILLAEEKDKNDLKMKIKQSEQKIKSFSDDIEAKKKAASQSTRKIEKLEKLNSEKEVSLTKFKSDIEKKDQTISDLKKEQQKLRSELSEKRKVISDFEKQKQNEDTSVASSYKKLQNDYTNLEKKHKDYKETSTKEIESLKNECGKKAEELSNVQKELEKLKKLSKENEEKVKSLQQNINDIEQSNKKMVGENKLLQSRNQKLTKDIETLKNPDHESHSRTHSLEEKMPSKGASKNLWDELSKKENKIQELEKLLKEKSKQLVTLKKNQSIDREKQMLNSNESKKNEAEINSQINQLKTDITVKDKRIAMLEDALRESVSIAVEREDILARHVEISEGNSKQLSEVESECDRIATEKAIVNFKNAFLILTLSERDALIASMRANRKRYLEELFNIKRETLLAAITEKDQQIGNLEFKNQHNKQIEIKKLKREKDKLVSELKDQNNTTMILLSNDSEENLIVDELSSAPAEQVYEAIRFLAHSSGKLEYYIEDLCNFLRDKNSTFLDGLPVPPKRKSWAFDDLKKAGKQELLKELKSIDADNRSLKKYVDRMLDKLRD